MKPPRYGGWVEYDHYSRNAGQALGQFLLANLPPGVEEAMDNQVIVPTVEELIRLTGIELDGLPGLTLDDLIGPTRIGELDRRTQAFYFSGPMHPVLVKAQMLPTFVTYDNMLRVHGDLGIRKTEVTKNFRGLLQGLFEDEEVQTFGEPEDFRAGACSVSRFAIRREIAQRAMRGEYRVGVSGTPGGPVFTGYGRALLRAVYDRNEGMRRMELTVELESIDDLLVSQEDSCCFDWEKVYTNSEGMGYKVGFYGPVKSYVYGLLREIGAINKGWWPREEDVSEEGFIVAVNALCPLDTKHTKIIKMGRTCPQGVHCEGLTAKDVRRAKAVTMCIAEKAEMDEGDPAEGDEVEINLLDPGLSPLGVLPS